MQQAAKKNMQDLSVALHVKNRIVEIDTISMQEAIRADARMLHVEHVTQFNQAVRERGGACVHILKEIRDFKVGIYKMLYECKRLDMEGEDASTRVRDLQLLRVTSELNQVRSRLKTPLCKRKSLLTCFLMRSYLPILGRRQRSPA